MSKFSKILTEHKIAIILAILTSILITFPQVAFRIEHKDLYQEGVEAIEMLPDSPWSPRVREVLDGHPNWGSIYFKDGKDDPYLFQPLGSIVVAYTGSLFGLEINNILLLSRIVFPFLTFVLMYSFVYLLSKNKFAALTSTSAILLADSILAPSGLKALLTGGIILNGLSPTNFLELARPVNSAMIFIFFFGFLVSFWLYYRKNTPYWGLASALLLGLNFYNYFYSWTYLFAFGGVLCLILLLQRKWSEVTRISYVFLGALVVAAPYIMNLYHASLYPSYEVVAERFGVVVSHAPQFIGVTVLCALVVFLVGFPRTDSQRYLFSISLLLAPFVTLNQQLITGKVLQAGHYHWYTHKPIAVIFVAVTVFYLLDRWNINQVYKRFIATSIILVSFTVGLSVQVLSYYDFTGKGDGGIVAIERQRYAEPIHWLDTHVTKESVVFANEVVSNIVVIYTPLNVFHQRADHYALVATRKRMEDIVFTYYRLQGVEKDNVRDIFFSEKIFLSTRLFGVYYRDLGGGWYDDIPNDVLDEIINNYMQTLTTPADDWLYDVWKKYEVEYLVWDKKIDPEWQLDTYSFLKQVASFGDVTIYKLITE